MNILFRRVVCERAGLACALFMAIPLGRVCAVSAPAAEDIRRDATVNAIEQVMPSVVNIATETVQEYNDWYDDLLRRFYGWPNRQQKSISLGSGVIIDEEGYVLTNFHVVRRATRVQVKLWDGREFEAEPLVATTKSDVALLKLKVPPGQKFKAIRFAPDDDLLLGETVLALGNPFGLGGSVTRGILSSKNRRPSTGNEPLNVEDWLQTDAAINPGNSGGPLVNLRGELIGLNVAVYREEHGERGMGVGFSIPVRQVASALSQFFTPEIMHSLCFGVQVKSEGAALVATEVQPGGPAARAGLRAGDRIESVNGRPAPGVIDFNRLVGNAPGQVVHLVTVRAKERHTVDIHLVPLDQFVRDRIGADLAEPSASAAAGLTIVGVEGLLVTRVEDGGPAERARLTRGHYVTAIDGRKVENLVAAAQQLAAKGRGQPVRLSIAAPRRLGGGYVELREAAVDVPTR